MLIKKRTYEKLHRLVTSHVHLELKGNFIYKDSEEAKQHHMEIKTLENIKEKYYRLFRFFLHNILHLIKKFLEIIFSQYKTELIIYSTNITVIFSILKLILLHNVYEI